MSNARSTHPSRSKERRHQSYLRGRTGIIEISKARYRDKKDEILAQYRERYRSDEKFREAVRARSIQTYRNRHPGARTRAEISPAGPLSKKEHNRRWAAKVTDRLFAALGGRCACCGITDRAFLTLDHIQGDGAAHRRAVNKGRGGIRVYARVLADGVDSSRFRLLCMNCNWATRYGKQCPHEVEREIAI